MLTSFRLHVWRDAYVKDLWKSVILAFLLVIQGYPYLCAQQAAAPQEQQPAPQAAPAAAAAPAPAAAPVANSAPAPAPAAAAAPALAKLTEGSDVQLAFDEDVSSKTATEGDPVAFVLTDDLKVGNVIVAKAGCKAFGEVSHAEKSGMMGKPGDLSIRLDYLKVGDVKVRLRGTKGKEGESGTGSAVALTVLFGPIGLIKHGKNIDIKKGTALKAYVADDVSLPPAV
jgi:hypothetical protein